MISRRASTVCLVSGLLLLFAGSTVAQKPTGESWEFSMTMQMGGMNMAMPGQKSCVKPEEAAAPRLEGNCKTSDQQTSGTTTRFKIVCGPPRPMSGTGEVTRSGDRMEGRYAMKSPDGDMTMALSGRKLGSCTPGG